MKAPPNLTGPQARVLMQCLELLVDSLIELYTATVLEYPEWSEPEPEPASPAATPRELDVAKFCFDDDDYPF